MEQEIANIKKCLESGYDYVVSVCSDGKQLPLIKTETKKSFTFKERKRLEFLGIKKNTLYEWIIQKKIPHIKGGRLVKFRREDLEKWLRKRTQKEDKREYIKATIRDLSLSNKNVAAKYSAMLRVVG